MASGKNEPIAIVGTGCRFPGGANTPSKLWDLLREPYDVSREIPPERFNVDRYYHKVGNHHGTTNVRRAYLLSEDVALFDNQFFSISPGEAEAIDPQQRILLEVTYEAVDSAGLTLSALHGSDTAVYVGIMCDDFRLQQSQDLDLLPTYNATGTASSNASSRISYFFDWHGPSMTIDTACSSSLIALNQAVRTLRDGTSKVAVACGTNLALFPFAYVTESNLNMLSPNGRCHMWDEKADGYARGEGIAAVVLKTLSDAIRDGDDIQCIVREIGANHDGKTTGLTMPSASAQAKLIRRVYDEAGLDPSNPNDRCQYFEAHGTGTPAGDPQEAEALKLAFFEGRRYDDDDVLHVGSVKTVIGHTEGAAGLAGVIKAAQALKHGLIPPNLHFNQMSPKVKPFARHLRIPTTVVPWPRVANGSPRRASVNSFGFGGANAHVILESYTPSSRSIAAPKTPLAALSSSSSSISLHSASSDTDSTAASSTFDAAPLIPFVFSAASSKSLQGYLQSFATYLNNNAHLDAASLAHALHTKKSALACRAAFPASSIGELLGKIESRLEDPEGLGETTRIDNPSILGIFTGQGAQWATMGAELLESVPQARSIMEELERALSALPEEHRPRWTLARELLAQKTTRINKAEISQPVCTAIQIILVDLLRLAGVKLAAVVGHSSGEIGAAYAAGFLSKSAAIQIAYYRGYYAHLAASPSGGKGGMMALGTSIEDARELCALEDFEGRVSIAAHNSTDSITLSGDLDAIEEVKAIFDEEKKFARPLRVDTAYHSHHLLPCSGPYMDALRNCNIKVLRPGEKDAPKWFSSVYDGKLVEGDLEGLDGQYWVDNMNNPVLFYPALSRCLSSSGLTLNLALEIGPHPALKGPATSTIQEVTGEGIPYFGTLSRGKNDLEAFKAALGSLWETLGSARINLSLFEKSCYDELFNPSSVPTLPSYSWSHDKPLWAEARSCRSDRLQGGYYHELLGKMIGDGSANEWHWKNVLKVQQISWLAGHALQGQTVFPATGYIALAMEAAMQVAGNRTVKLIELRDLKIPKAIAINETSGTEVHIRMIGRPSANLANDDSVVLDFAASSAVASKDINSLGMNCSGEVHILFADPTEDFTKVLAPRAPTPAGTVPVKIDEFYSSLRDDLGYNYEGPFRGMKSLQRKRGYSTGTIANPVVEDGSTPLLFHPALGDCALQGMYSTISYPGDGMLWSILVPSGCRRISLVPALCGPNMTNEVAFECKLVETKSGDALMPGDVNVYSCGYRESIIQFEGLTFAPFAAATSKDDRLLFQKSLWCAEGPDGEAVIGDRRPTAWERQKALDAERAAFFYLKNLHLSVSKSSRATLPWYRQAMLEYCEMIYETVASGRHDYGDDADFNLTRAVGENLPKPEVLCGDENILQYMTQNDWLSRYYQKGQGFEFSNESVARLIAQLAVKFPGMHFCEIGAGTGGSTHPILDRIGDSFASYTYTDISNGFFEAGQKRLQAYEQRMIFKVLDIEKNPLDQNFAAHSFDCIVAANVLHATRSLEQTLRNVRTLLKPGGYLVLYEGLGNDVMRFGAVMGGIPGWWVGRDDGRRWAPTVTLDEWDGLFRKTGFSGIEASTPMIDKVSVPHTIFCTMAVDENISLLKNPLSKPPTQSTQETLVLVGGTTSTVSGAIEDLRLSSKTYFGEIITVKNLDSVPEIPKSAHIVSLADCDEPIFKNMTQSRWKNLQKLLESARSILWVTAGAYLENPYAGMSVGLLRNLFYELIGTGIHLFNFENTKSLNADVLTKLLLQMQVIGRLGTEGKAHRDLLLWTVEPELRLEGGRLQMHRVLPDIQRNSRLNAARRPITRASNVDSEALKLQPYKDAYILKEGEEPTPQSAVGDVTINVTTSLISSIKTPAGFCYVSLGKVEGTEESVLCLSDSNASKLVLHKSWTYPTGLDHIIDRQYLSFATGLFLNEQILKVMPQTGSLLAHEADSGLASLLSKQLALRGQKAFFSTTSADWKHRLGNWVHLHERSPPQVLHDAIPTDVSMYLDASTSIEDARGLASQINLTVPDTCERLKLFDLTAKSSSRLPIKAPETIVSLLQRVVSFSAVQANGVPDGAPLDVFPLRTFLSSETKPNDAVALVEWASDMSVPVSYEPITAPQHLFRGDKTYWFAGLSGDLGRSLADFMATRGAKHIALSSRNPPQQDEWVEWHKANGTQIRFFKNDVTDLPSLRKVVAEIRATMPPIAGVANGAMVLSDRMFTQMTHKDFQYVLRPKVEGTMHLDSLFSEDSDADPLDWFIVFSSLVATRGNPGQSNYAAANCFMKTLVANRQARGLAGSSIDISRVVGLGYVARELMEEGRLTKEQKERLVTGAMAMAMSETDMHQLFTEAVVAGRPGTTLDHEVITGIAPVLRETANMNLWPGNPMFGLLLREKDEAAAQAGAATTAQVPVKTLLQEAKTEADVILILKDSISDKVRRALFMAASDTLSESTPLVEVGVDSLIGVDIRTWFLKELSLDVPVMKILGGVSISDLAENARENLPSDLIDLKH
ncbi:hypothetical protein GGR53DRAFT_464558 [Hypoxylon sp. FL1150]|nr:hypothetical protein GGR53DRAFT_464558 [Hypoxylon sp. FL1150]